MELGRSFVPPSRLKSPPVLTHAPLFTSAAVQGKPLSAAAGAYQVGLSYVNGFKVRSTLERPNAVQ